MPLSVLKLYSFNDMMIRECGEGTEARGENSPSATLLNQGYGMSFKMFLGF
jgi:hypothetical protein